jgi:hypothetical protein
LLEHIDRLEAIKALDLSESGQHQTHQNRLLKLAREGSQMTAQHLRDLEPDRRYATLVAVMLETKATITTGPSVRSTWPPRDRFPEG